MRRTEPLHPTALLIDQHRGPGVADGVAKFFNKPKDLLGRLNVAFKQDAGPRPGFAQKGAFVGEKFGSRQSGDECSRRHQGRLARVAGDGQGKGAVIGALYPEAGP
jgi:hypothetical protein